MNRLRYSLIFILLLLSIHNRAQYYSTGADPWNVRFKQLRGDNYRLVADEKLYKSTLLLSNILDSVCLYDYNSLSFKPKPIDVIVHSRSAFSNGLVSWAPARAEFYSFQSQGADCEPWLMHLAIHEYRHAVQTNSLKRGFTNVLYYPFGQQVLGFVLGIYVPMWFLEGDAVAQETALTHGGRGRSAKFDMQFRTITLQRNRPTYDEAYLGSYKQWFPDYYHQGYLTIAATRIKYGPQLWSNVLENCARRSWSITPFNHSLHQQTGKRRVDIYNEAIDFWSEQWLQQDKSIISTDFKIVKSPNDDYDEYLSPHLCGETIIACKSSPKFLTKFVAIDTIGNEQNVHIPAYLNEADFDIHGDTIVWCERRLHPRWENASNGCLMIGNVKRKKFHRLTHRGFYAAPTISSDGKKIAVVYVDFENRTFLKVLDTNGDELASHELRNTENLESPCWLNDNSIAYIVTDFDGKRIEIIDKSLVKTKILLQAKFFNRHHLTADSENIYFTSDKSGIDNIYILPIEGGEPQRITSARFGADWPHIDKQMLYYSNYTSSGYQIVKTPITTRATDNPIAPLFIVADSLTSLEGRAITVDTTLHDKKISNFSRWNIFNIHSWGPVIADADNQMLKSGLSVASQDLRGTTIISAGMSFDKDNSDEQFFVTASYNALYPKLKLSATHGHIDYDFSGYYTTENSTKYRYISYNDKQKISRLKFSVNQPLGSVVSAWQWHVEPYASVTLNNESAIKYTTQNFVLGRDNKLHNVDRAKTIKYGEAKYTEATYGIYLYWLRRTAIRDIGSRLGLTTEFIYRHTPWGVNMGSCRAIVANLYLPGIGRYHQIAINAQTQEKTLGETNTTPLGSTIISYLGDYVAMPRGYDKISNRQLSVIRANYSLPICAPDWSIGGLVYLKRITARGFFDIAQGKSLTLDGLSNNFSRKSIGIELSALTHWLRLIYPVNIGYRGSYRMYDEKMRHELLFSMSFK